MFNFLSTNFFYTNTLYFETDGHFCVIDKPIESDLYKWSPKLVLGDGKMIRDVECQEREEAVIDKIKDGRFIHNF